MPACLQIYLQAQQDFLMGIGLHHLMHTFHMDIVLSCAILPL